ncbi:MAG TPA: hypothetical protein VF511_03585 [Chthoniobacterales bacterium]
MKSKPHIITAACMAAVIICGPSLAFAAPKKSASPSPSESPAASAAASSKSGASPSEKSPRAIPFKGTATAVDQSAKTFTIQSSKASRVFKVTDKSTVTKDGQSAQFSDLSDNTAVTGSYWKQDDGTLEVKTLKIGGAKSSDKSSSKSSKSDAAGGAGSPSPSPKK